MKIQFRVDIRRAAIIDPNLTKGKFIKVGTVEFKEKTLETMKVEITLLPDLPEIILEAVKSNPACIRFLEEFDEPKEVLFTPGDTIITG